jgi:hypothetical protein
MRRLVRILLLVGAAAVGRAADEPAPPAKAAASDESSISSAKRDFDSIKAARDEALHPKSDLPRLSVPELQTGTPAPRAPGTDPANELRNKAKSPNWLVEAMEKGKTEARGRNSKNTAGKDSDPAEAWSADKPALTDLSGAEPKRGKTADSAERRESEPPPNPLAPYLAGWMTAKDYALLKPAANGNAGATTAITVPGVSPAAVGDSIATSRPETRLPLRGEGPAGLPPPSENPFLAALNLPSPAPAALPTAIPPAAVPSVPAAPALRYEPAPAPPPAVRVPDFARPANDDRYFKPLKRF